MTTGADELTIVSCLSGATLVTYIGTFADKTKTTTIKPLIGMFVAGSLLLAVSIWSGEVAKMFAIILLITSLVVNGKPLFDTLTKVTGGAVVK